MYNVTILYIAQNRAKLGFETECFGEPKQGGKQPNENMLFKFQATHGDGAGSGYDAVLCAVERVCC